MLEINIWDNYGKYKQALKLIIREGGYGAKNIIVHPAFHKLTIFNKYSMAIEMNQTEIVFDKHVYVRMAVL